MLRHSVPEYTPTISSLTLVEMRCLLARRRRMGTIDDDLEARAHALFREDVERRHIALEAIDDDDVRAAAELVARTRAHAVRTLDALHLTICTSRGIAALATADAVIAAAAVDLGITVERFD